MTVTPALDPTLRQDDIDAGSPRAVRMIGNLPPYFHDDPQVRAYICAAARELDRIEAAANALRTGAFPRTGDERTISYYEALFKLSATGLSLVQRRIAVLGHLRQRSVASRYDWSAALAVFIGLGESIGWSYVESPPNTILIHAPVDPSGARVPALTAFARAITPAHKILTVTGDFGSFQVGITPLGGTL